MSSPDAPLDHTAADHTKQDNVTVPEKSHHEGKLVIIHYMNTF